MTRRARSTLYLYGQGDLVKVDPNAIRVLFAQAQDLGLQLTRLDVHIPTSSLGIPIPFLGVARRESPAKEMQQRSDDGPNFERDVEVLQEKLNQAILFAKGERHRDQDRITRLINRRLAKLLYSAVAEHQPHELEYGLDVLGEVVDELSLTAPNRLDPFDSFDWFYRIPLNLIRRMGEQKPIDVPSAIELTEFLRSRMRLWLEATDLSPYRSAIRLYEQLLEEVVFLAASDSADSADAIALRVRELPMFVRDDSRRTPDQAFRSAAIIVVNAALRLCEKGTGHTAATDNLLKCAWDIFRFGMYRRDNDREFQRLAVEFAVGFLAAVMLQHEEVSSAEPLIPPVLGHMDRMGAESWFSPDIVFEVVRQTEQLIEQWGWRSWELRRKASGEAHWMAMGTWCKRASAILLARRYWRIAGVDGKDLPGLDVLDDLLSAIGKDDSQRAWISILSDTERGAIVALAQKLEEAKVRRQQFQDSLVPGLQLDTGKCTKWVQEVAKDIEESLAPHVRWLDELGCATAENERNANIDFVAYQTRIERSYFVQSGQLDRDVGLLPPPYGSNIVNFEVKQIASQLLRTHPDKQHRIASVSDPALWGYVDQLAGQVDVGTPDIYLIDTGIRDYNLWRILDEKGIRQHATDTRPGPRLVRAPRASGQPTALIAGVGARSFALTRFPPPEQLAAGIVRTIASAAATGIAVELAEITDELKNAWATQIEDQAVLNERRQEWQRSLLFRVAWSFRVDVLADAEYRVFILDPAGNNNAGYDDSEDD